MEAIVSRGPADRCDACWRKIPHPEPGARWQNLAEPFMDRGAVMNHRGGDPPTGVIALLFTDIEGSTRLARLLGAGWGDVLAAHHAIVRDAVRASGGWIDSSAGDGFCITFKQAASAGHAAVAIQRQLRSHHWPTAVGELRVRMGLHLADVEWRDDGYVGLEIHRAARVAAAAHGGQLLLTGPAAQLLEGVVPSQPLGAHRLKDFPLPIALHCAVIDGRGAAAFPPPRTLELRVGNLPACAGELIGRETDLQRVRAGLSDDGERLLTLLGRGGVGKTSVALAAANDLLNHYQGGVWWIDAAQITDAAGLWTTMAHVCRVTAPGSPADGLIADLGSRGETLLVLDNLEQIAGAGEALDVLVERLPDLAILATSQLPLRSRFERRLPLDSLELPDALALLSRAARRLGLSLEDESACTELVGLLDGLPLALELAAGRLRLFTPSELVQRLHDSPTVLQDCSRMSRQRSLAAALDWTLGLLHDEARLLFERLGAFAGPFELADVEAVAGSDGLDVVDAFDALVEAALVRRIETGEGRIRFGFPEAIRQEATRRLDASGDEATRRAHAERQRDLVWQLRIYEIMDSRLVQTGQLAAADTTAALRWAWEHDPQLAREIALGRFALAHHVGALGEARVLIEQIEAHPGEDPRIVDLVRVHRCGESAYSGGRADRFHSVSAYTSLLPQITDAHARFLCCLNLSVALSLLGRFDEALTRNEQALEHGKSISPLAEANALAVRGDILLEAGRYAEAEEANRAADFACAGTRTPALERIEITRAELASRRGDHRDAFATYARFLTDAEVAGDRDYIDIVFECLVRALARGGRPRAMLEVAGIVETVGSERVGRGGPRTLVWDEPEPAIATALHALGPEGEALLSVGRTIAPAARVKRVCALLYSDEP